MLRVWVAWWLGACVEITTKTKIQRIFVKASRLGKFLESMKYRLISVASKFEDSMMGGILRAQHGRRLLCRVVHISVHDCYFLKGL